MLFKLGNNKTSKFVLNLKLLLTLPCIEKKHKKAVQKFGIYCIFVFLELSVLLVIFVIFEAHLYMHIEMSMQTR